MDVISKECNSNFSFLFQCISNKTLSTHIIYTSIYYIGHNQCYLCVIFVNNQDMIGKFHTLTHAAKLGIKHTYKHNHCVYIWPTIARCCHCIGNVHICCRTSRATENGLVIFYAVHNTSFHLGFVGLYTIKKF